MRKTLPVLLAAASLAAVAAQPAAAQTALVKPAPAAADLVKPAKTYTPDVPTAKARYAVQRKLDNGWSSGRECATQRTRGYLKAFGAQGYFIPGCETEMQRCPEMATNPGTGERLKVTRCWVEAISTIQTEKRLRHRVTLNQRINVYDGQNQWGWADDKSCAGIAYCSVHSGNQKPVVNPYINEAPQLWVNPGEGLTVECNGVRSVAPNTAGVSCHLRVYWSTL